MTEQEPTGGLPEGAATDDAVTAAAERTAQDAAALEVDSPTDDAALDDAATDEDKTAEPDYGLTALFRSLTDDPPESRLTALGVRAAATRIEREHRTKKRNRVLGSAAAVAAVVFLGFTGNALFDGGTGSDTAASSQVEAALTLDDPWSAAAPEVLSAAATSAAASEGPTETASDTSAVTRQSASGQDLLNTRSSVQGGVGLPDSEPYTVDSAAASESATASGPAPETGTPSAGSAEAKPTQPSRTPMIQQFQLDDLKTSVGDDFSVAASGPCLAPLFDKAVINTVAAALPDGVNRKSASRTPVACDLAESVQGVTFTVRAGSVLPAGELQLVAMKASSQPASFSGSLTSIFDTVVTSDESPVSIPLSRTTLTDRFLTTSSTGTWVQSLVVAPPDPTFYTISGPATSGTVVGSETPTNLSAVPTGDSASPAESSAPEQPPPTKDASGYFYTSVKAAMQGQKLSAADLAALSPADRELLRLNTVLAEALD